MKSEFIRNICLALPGVTEDVKWGHDLCFLIGGKMFCVTGIEGDFGVSLKVRDDEFDALTSISGIIPAPYLARHKWIHVSNSSSFSLKDWKHYLQQSYALVKAKLPVKKKPIAKKATAKKK